MSERPEESYPHSLPKESTNLGSFLELSCCLEGLLHNGQVRPDYGLGWKKEGKCAEAIGAGAIEDGLIQYYTILQGEVAAIRDCGKSCAGQSHAINWRLTIITVPTHLRSGMLIPHPPPPHAAFR